MVYYTMELYGEQHNHVRWWWKPFERFFVKRGIDALITQNDARARIYVEERGASVIPTIVHNYKPWRKIAASGKLRERLDLPQDVRIILYEGLLGRGRWLDNLVLSAVHLPDDVRLVFMGKPSDWWVTNVRPLLDTKGIAGRVLMAPWVPHSELPGYVADADVGVIIYDNSVRNNYYCEPGKLSDYVLAGVPVIAPNFPTIQPVVQRYNIGAVFEDPSPQSIAAAINKVLDAPKSAWQKPIEAAQKDLIWETQYPALEQAILGENPRTSVKLLGVTPPGQLKSECPAQ
jgi:glycosyltransferase involved in cell wall biosynthesis